MANITYTITQDGEEISYTINDGVGPVGPAGPSNITTATETDITGILKGDGANVSAAVEDTDYQGVPAEGAFIDGDKTKLDGIEAGADVTDAANVDAAGAVMESDYSPAHSVLAQQSGTGSPSSVSLGTNSLLGRASGAGTAIQGLTAAQARTLLNVEDGATADQTAAEILTAIKTVDGTGSGLDADLLDGQEATAFATSAQGSLADSAVQPGDIDTLAELNAIITDATLIDTTDSRLSDARTPTAHTHTASDLDFAGSTDIGADLADADEVLVSDGGGNTTRVKSALSRFWTYIKAKIESVGLSSLNISGNLTVDTNTLHVDSASNEVGIGTTSPASKLEVYHNTGSTARITLNNPNTGGSAVSQVRMITGANASDSDAFYFTNHAGTHATNPDDVFFYKNNTATKWKFVRGSTQVLEIDNNDGHITTLSLGGITTNDITATDITATGQVELTGQAASTDDSAMTRSLVDQNRTLLPNCIQLHSMTGAASGTGATSTNDFTVRGDARLRCGSSAGAYSSMWFSKNVTAQTTSRIDYSRRIELGGVVHLGANDTADGVVRLVIGASNTSAVPPLADADAMTGAGIGIEFDFDSGSSNKRVRIIYHNGTTYKQSAWVTYVTASGLGSRPVSYQITNVGDGNIHLRVSVAAGTHNGANPLNNVAASLSVSDGPTGTGNLNENAILASVVQNSASYVNYETAVFLPMMLKIN